MAFEVQWRCNCFPPSHKAGRGDVEKWIGNWRTARQHRHASLDDARRDLAQLVMTNAETVQAVTVREPLYLAILKARALEAQPGEDICPDLRFSHRIVEV